MPKLISTQFIVTESELKGDYYIYKLSTFDDNSKSLKAGFISKWNDLNPLKLSEEEIEARRKSTSFEWLDSGNDTENSNIHFWRNIDYKITEELEKILSQFTHADSIANLEILLEKEELTRVKDVIKDFDQAKITIPKGFLFWLMDSVVEDAFEESGILNNASVVQYMIEQLNINDFPHDTRTK